ncbi:MAG: hypothetical protein ABT940_14375 [Alphaproteobacteria bacterium]
MMGNINWRATASEKPQDEQLCLTICKHGMIQGSYNAKEGYFEGYFWNDISWNAGKWVPIEEVEP